MKYVFWFNLKRNVRFCLILFFTLIVGFIVSIMVFFRVDSVQVSGDTRYNASEVVKSSGIGIGGNLFFCRGDNINNNIRKKLPYISSVSVERYFPNKILLTVYEAKGCAYVPYGNSFALLDKDEKVLDILDVIPENVAKIVGVNMTNVTPGEAVNFVDENSRVFLSKIFSGMEKCLDDLTEINLSDSYALAVVFQNRIKILLGSSVGLDYKIKTAVKILSEKISNDATGTLDVSLVNDNGKSYFKQ